MVQSAYRVILILWIKPRKCLILPSHHLHEKYSNTYSNVIFQYIFQIKVEQNLYKADITGAKKSVRFIEMSALQRFF